MTLATTPKPEPRLLKQNVYLDRATHVLAGIGRDLVGLSKAISFRDTISPDDIGEVRDRLASATAALADVSREANATDSGFLLDGADAYAAASLSAKRNNGAAS